MPIGFRAFFWLARRERKIKIVCDAANTSGPVGLLLLLFVSVHWTDDDDDDYIDDDEDGGGSVRS